MLVKKDPMLYLSSNQRKLIEKKRKVKPEDVPKYVRKVINRSPPKTEIKQKETDWKPAFKFPTMMPVINQEIMLPIAIEPVPTPKISKHKDWAGSKLWAFIRDKHLRQMYDQNLIENHINSRRPTTPKRFMKPGNDHMTDEEQDQIELNPKGLAMLTESEC